MSTFIAGSAYAMARGIADGYHQVTERTFKTMNAGELVQLAQEMDKHLREVRSEQPLLDDLPAVKHRGRKIGRLNNALMILRNYQQTKGKSQR